MSAFKFNDSSNNRHRDIHRQYGHSGLHQSCALNALGDVLSADVHRDNDAYCSIPLFYR